MQAMSSAKALKIFHGVKKENCRPWLESYHCYSLTAALLYDKSI